MNTPNSGPNSGDALPDIEAAQLTNLIPHRVPFVMVDRVKNLIAFQSAVGIKNVSFTEPALMGHFPGDPIYPGIYIVESMAQTAAALVVSSRNRSGQGDGVYFTTVDKARFKAPVRPGDQLELHVSLMWQRLGVWRFKGDALVDGVSRASAEFAAKVFDGGTG